ncbi:MAG: hypothetical protein FWG14_13135 [Peptococcaceae bacterium]|nr:hypothetical protein [Peptococcaceae bacterium]
MKKAPGRTLLLVTGIIFIVFGALAFVSLLVALTLPVDADNFGIVFVAFVIIANIAAGIMGIVQGKDASKSKALIIVGIVLLGINVFEIVWRGAPASERTMTIGRYIGYYFTNGFGIITSILYLVGAFMNRKAHKALSQEKNSKDNLQG